MEANLSNCLRLIRQSDHEITVLRIEIKPTVRIPPIFSPINIECNYTAE